ncbi:MAG: ABC transporter ATP-binding protein [Tabrizicola sp.]|jgi:ABC-type Fe3+/spermidine/putrescine transport system ATPase subunit|nr:ABC transporter ATP-binding protein [Tabrizicola sp.]
MTLELRDVTKTFSDDASSGVRNVSLRLPEGQLTALLGPSGAGKTTAMRLIAGLLAPDSGDILLDGTSILPLPPERRGIVLVFQNALLFPHMSLAENVAFGLKMRGLPRDETARRVAEMLDLVQLTGLGSRRPHELSGGQLQRGALARALVLKPRLMLLDEPLSSLDVALREDMRDLIRHLQRATGVTLLMVTHDQSEAVALADRIALMMAGRLIQEAGPDEIFQRPNSVATARFFGGTNFLPGRADKGRFISSLGPLVLPPGQPNGPGVLTIRPEAVQLVDGSGDVRAQVTEKLFLGSQTRVRLLADGVPLTALVAPDRAEALSPGSWIGVRLPTHALWVLPAPAAD